MSQLEEEDLDRIYTHIGIGRNKQSGHSDEELNQHNKSDFHESKGRKDVPRIIRKTEIIVDDNNVVNDKKENKDFRNNRRDYVRVADSNEGLMVGMSRKSNVDKFMKKDNQKKNRNELEQNNEVSKIKHHNQDFDNKHDSESNLIDDELGIMAIKKVVKRKSPDPDPVTESSADVKKLES